MGEVRCRARNIVAIVIKVAKQLVQANSINLKLFRFRQLRRGT